MSATVGLRCRQLPSQAPPDPLQQFAAQVSVTLHESLVKVLYTRLGCFMIQFTRTATGSKRQADGYKPPCEVGRGEMLRPAWWSFSLPKNRDAKGILLARTL